MIDEVFVDWSDTNSRDYGKKLVHIKHRLHESPLFSEEALAELIELYPREHYDLHTMTVKQGKHEAETWRDGDIGGRKGAEVIQAIRNGHIWINLRKVMQSRKVW